jgi:hypothetical protein
MKFVVRGFLISMLIVSQSLAITQPAISPVTTISAVQAASNNTEVNTSSMPVRNLVSPHIIEATHNMFHNTQQNLNLYVTQLQCQSQGSTKDCSNINSTNNPPLMNNVNEFLFNSITSELGVGVEVKF